MLLSAQKQKRKRGVLLTPQALNKLQDAKSNVEFHENSGKRLTLEDMSDRTGLSVDTLMKIFACEEAVDKQTLKCCFRAFNLTLEPSDYFLPEPQLEALQPLAAMPSAQGIEPEFPGGQVPLDSPGYLDRFPCEANSYKAIVQPGALIRIKAPRRMGKTSLMARMLHQADQKGYRTVSLSFQLADKAVFQSLDKLLQWLCASVSLGLQLPNHLTNYWDDLFGSKVSCKMYFERYLLTESEHPLVLALDDVDRLFQYPDLADDFFGLLRAWHEEAKNREIWKRLRLIVVHSSEVYIPLNTNQSPFNVGLPIELPELTPEQVQNLAQLYGLECPTAIAEQLMALVGGHPYLVQLALYHLWHRDVTLEQLMQQSPIPDVFQDHLQRQLWNLQRDKELADAFGQVITTPASLKLNLAQASKLRSMWLVHLQGNQATLSCKLYAQYFRNYFSDKSSQRSGSEC
jgi:hypothetical protein